MTEPTLVRWTEDGAPRAARWLSSRDEPAPRELRIVDDRLTADEAYGLACQGVGLLWRGDFQNARQLLRALDQRATRGARRRPGEPSGFHRERQRRAQRARTLGKLLVELDGEHRCALRRAPDVQQACLEAFGPPDGPALLALNALQGAIGAHQWRVRGIDVPEAGGRIHPHYGVFAPVRSEYLRLVAEAPLPEALAATPLAVDVGTGTGVLAAILARRGIGRVLATDLDPRALACASENLQRLGLAGSVEVVAADLFPSERAALVVCNPPWLPARPTSSLEAAIYDPDGAMLARFLDGLATHLVPGGEGWLVLSDLAERLGLRAAGALRTKIEAAGLRVVGTLEARAVHPRAADPDDPLHAARQGEVTTLWRLRAAA